MTSESWNAAKTLFGAAFELDPESREHLLIAADRKDPALARHVRALLASHALAATSFLEPPPKRVVEEVFGSWSQRIRGVRLGKYELREEIGRGASSIVYRGVRSSDGCQVAVKVLAPHLARQPEVRRRLEREARASARLSHPALVPVLDRGEARGVPFLVLELVRGESLHRRLEGRRSSPDVDDAVLDCDPHEPRNAAAIAWRIAEALDHCHARGVIHGDVKPANVLVTKSGEARLLDFGIWKERGQREHEPAELRLGTLPYMSPERLGECPCEPDPASDVYALGATLYELLTLRRAFDGPSPAHIAQQILREPLVPVRTRAPHVPQPLAVLCEAALSREREARIPGAAALAAALQSYLEEAGPEATRDTSIAE